VKVTSAIGSAQRLEPVCRAILLAQGLRRQDLIAVYTELTLREYPLHSG
jgi:hypothetical protein